MKHFLTPCLCSVLLWVGAVPAPAQEKDSALWERAMKIHGEAIVIDAHAHAQLFDSPEPHSLDLGHKTENSQIDFVTMEEGGVDAVFMSMPLRGEASRNKGSKAILESIEHVRRQLDEYSTLGELALTAVDLKRIHDRGKRAVVLCVEERNVLERRIGTLEVYDRHGIRMITLNDHRDDAIAVPDSGDSVNSHLSEFGLQVVQEMNRLGMLIDVTHLSDSLQLEIIEKSKDPIVASHSCVRALHDKPRNVPDPILEAIADRGGIVAITFHSNHLSPKPIPPRVEVDVLIDHIDHAVRVAGIDHIALGSDFGGRGGPIGLETAEGFPLISYHLLKRGYKAEEIKKILGGNLLRVLEEIREPS